MKRFFSLLVASILITGMFTAANPLPNTTFVVVQDLPATMKVGETYTVIVQVNSNQQFIAARTSPSFQYVGRGAIAVQGGSRAGRGTFAVLPIKFKANSSTARMPGGIAPVHVVVRVRYESGYVKAQRYVFHVRIP